MFAPPSACILMFWIGRDVSGWGVGAFPPANDSAQVTLEMDKLAFSLRMQKEKFYQTWTKWTEYVVSSVSSLYC